MRLLAPLSSRLSRNGTRTAEPPLKHHAVVIIGGGVGGLYTALRLLEETPGMDVQLFESRGMLGGRVQTTRDGEGKPLFNDFGALHTLRLHSVRLHSEAPL